MGFLDKMKDKQSAALERQSEKRSDKFDKKHRADFESDLLPGESILCFTDHVSTERDGTTYHGWLVGTNQRLMYRAKFATKSLVELHPFGAATSITFAKEKVFGVIGVRGIAGSVEYKGGAAAMEEFMATINSAAAVEHVEAAPEPATSATDELAKLADLHSQGILSDEEFGAAKQRIIDGM